MTQVPNNSGNGKLGQDPIRQIALADIVPSPENKTLYRPVNSSDPDILKLAASIKKHGVKEPLVLSLDNYIVSGHRRFCAAGLAGLDAVPCRIENIRHDLEPDRWTALLREYNLQRDKTRSEILREEVVDADPEEAYQSLIECRQQNTIVTSNCEIKLRGRKGRSKISSGKAAFVQAIQLVLCNLRDFWPISVRTLHYKILNDPPLRHTAKSDSEYTNDKNSYKSLIDILVRLRLLGEVPWEAFADETRPVTTWNVTCNTREFVSNEFDGLLKGYWRDLQQSQPNHIEILCEKNTLLPFLKPIAMQYTIPITAGRGYCSLPPRHEMAQRFKNSGKDELILLIISDFDPDGEEIAHSYARSMRDDFDVNVHAIKVALTKDQAVEHGLPNSLDAKKTSTNYKRFAAKYGDDSWEVEALDPYILQELLRTSIDDVLDTDAFNAEIDNEKKDAAHLQDARQKIHNILGNMDGGLLT